MEWCKGVSDTSSAIASLSLRGFHATFQMITPPCTSCVIPAEQDFADGGTASLVACWGVLDCTIKTIKKAINAMADYYT